MHRHLLAAIFGSGLAATACSGASSSASGELTSTAPGAALLQYAGEYDGTGSFTQLLLHDDGSFEATIAGHTSRGVYGAASRGEAGVRLQGDDGSVLTASLYTDRADDDMPPQTHVEISPGSGAVQKLWAPWVASNEGMCQASGGTWHGEEAETTFGLPCTCPGGDVYLPSRGGCVAPRGSDDPPRLPPSSAALQRAGIFDGSERVSTITLATDGRYRATIDGVVEEGTWWDATYSPYYGEDSGVAIGCTSGLHAFAAWLEDDGSLSLRLGSEGTESLRRRTQ